MFGDENEFKRWPCKSVNELAKVSVGVVIKPAQYYTEDKEHGIPVLRPLNVGEMCLKDDNWIYFSSEGNEKNKKSILQKNDVVIVRSGAPGTACVITDKYAGYNAIDVIIARPDITKVRPEYLCAFTNYPHGRRQIEAGSGGAAQQHFNVGKYNEVKILVLSLNIQDCFITFMKEVLKSKLGKIILL